MFFFILINNRKEIELLPESIYWENTVIFSPFNKYHCLSTLGNVLTRLFVGEVQTSEVNFGATLGQCIYGLAFVAEDTYYIVVSLLGIYIATKYR